MPHSVRAGRALAIVLVTSGLWLAGAPAAAQLEYGVRAGVSGSPDQFYFGGHIQTAPLIDQVRFRPNIEIGLGDDLTLVAFNVEFVYRFALRSRGWDAYLGGGPAANYYTYKNWRNRDAGVEPGFNLVAGLAHRDGLFAELKLGAVDSPSVRFGVGFAWR